MTSCRSLVPFPSPVIDANKNCFQFTFIIKLKQIQSRLWKKNQTPARTMTTTLALCVAAPNSSTSSSKEKSGSAKKFLPQRAPCRNWIKLVMRKINYLFYFTACCCCCWCGRLLLDPTFSPDQKTDNDRLVVLGREDATDWRHYLREYFIIFYWEVLQEIG